MQFGEYVKELMDKRELSFRRFAEEINPYFPKKEQISHMAVKGWVSGALPRYTWLDWLREHAPADSWQREFAERGMDCLQPVGETGKPETVKGIASPATPPLSNITIG